MSCMPFNRLTFVPVRVLALLCVVLCTVGGCATTPSARLAEKAGPVQALWIVVSLGSFGELGQAGNAARAPGGEASRAMQARLPDTFRRNGVPVSGYRELDRPLWRVEELGRLWGEQRPLHGTTSHVLVLTGQRLVTRNQASSVEYEAVLWETKGETLVWKAAPVAPVRVSGRSAEIGAEILAGDLLRLLHRDALITLPQGHPLDGSGREIPVQWRSLAS